MLVSYLLWLFHEFHVDFMDLRHIFSLHFEIFEIGMYFITTATLLMLSARIQSLTVCYCLCMCNFGHRYDTNTAVITMSK